MTPKQVRETIAANNRLREEAKQILLDKIRKSIDATLKGSQSMPVHYSLPSSWLVDVVEKGSIVATFPLCPLWCIEYIINDYRAKGWYIEIETKEDSFLRERVYIFSDKPLIKNNPLKRWFTGCDKWRPANQKEIENMKGRLSLTGE